MNIEFEDVLYECNQRARRKKKIYKVLTDDILKKIINQIILDYREDLPNFNIDKEKLFKELQKAFVTHETIESSILSDDHKPWLNYNETNINWKYWNRYKEYLSKKNWSESAINQIDDDTYKVLDRLWDPTKCNDEDQWDRRGMVVGNVQSGKTANFTGLICKAADAGFKVIIVLAGMHDSLRIQTQKRLDEEFLGYKSDSGEESKQLIGVSNISKDNNWVDTITTQAVNGDFNKKVSNNFNRHMSSTPILLVVKKNVYVLKNIIKWLNNTAQMMDEKGNKCHSGYPLLLIDDEADNASVDTSELVLNEDGTPDKNHDPKAINRSIRKILKFFKQSAYVAYTATPQANIYIHPNAKTDKEGPDLYPRHFILNLEASSEYFGPKTIFGDEKNEGLDLIREIEDYYNWVPDGHKSALKLYEDQEIPNSLKQAIHGFIISTAIRISRGQKNKHNSMLIHVTRFTEIQNKVNIQVVKYVKEYLLENINNENSLSKDFILNEFKKLWENDYYQVTKEINDNECTLIEWNEIKSHIYEIIRLIKIKEINGSAKDVLDYDLHKEKGLITIAIGGDKLSRGLTLEGLTTSYYLRASKMYDTLMQMGRWFGYRPGYYDLCRLYTSKELNKHYRHITLADLEMREQFNYMEIIGSSPKDFSLKVRSHDSLLVTSKLKMRNSKSIQISFAGKRKESLMFYKNTNIIHNNFILFNSFISNISENRYTETKNKLIFKNIKPKAIIDFIDEYSSPEDSSFPKDRILDYIKKQSDNNYLKKWTIYIAQGRESNNKYSYSLSSEGKYQMTIRTISKKAEESGLNNDEKFFPGIIASRGDDTIDLLKDERIKALDMTIKDWEKKKGNKSEIPPTEPNDISARFHRDPCRGLLIIYPIYPQSRKEEYLIQNLPNIPMIGVAISFPENENDEKIEYIVDNKHQDQEFSYE